MRMMRSVVVFLTLCVVSWSAPVATAASPYCLGSSPAKALWHNSDQEVWVEWDFVNSCSESFQGWKYTLTISDNFGDTILNGTGKVWLKKPVKPKARVKANRTGAYGVFTLYGSDWYAFENWQRQCCGPQYPGDATWTVTVQQVL